MKKLLFPFLFVASILLISCGPDQDADTIINKSIEVSGMADLDGKEISFDFRGKKYTSERNNGRFKFTRTTKDSSVIVDVLTNDGFQRKIDGRPIYLADTTADKFKNSVNSVHYFANLPFGLNGGAVNKELLGQVDIKGDTYFKIKVWFDEEGGGEDFEDVFIYWINNVTYKVDYLAYEYHVNEGGMRFREAYKRRVVNGIDFVDYNNYKPKSKDVKLENLDELFEKGELELLSKIILENIEVK
ncbi:DUF6503 family protein [Galbibacter mesophilus]|uniref:DUF6503 family protein n=1 Tax=Galbibacter mesophilus TaxID=379069 RepID=UPI00191F8E06|nr:DUF6503 family protein [Galbibacter mesophilus]MCM5663475.1 deoxyribose-phosphate aldolase [Galbibacter mesophilus]